MRLSRNGIVLSDGITKTPFCPFSGSVRLGSKLTRMSFFSMNGVIRSYLKPRFSVKRELTFQSSCAKKPCYQLWTSIAGRFFKLNAAVVGGLPNRNSTNGSGLLSKQSPPVLLPTVAQVPGLV